MSHKNIHRVVGGLIAGMTAFAQCSAAEAPAAVVLPSVAVEASALSSVTNTIVSPALDAGVVSPVASTTVSSGYSYGASSISVLFLPLQIDKMKEALREYEAISSDRKVAGTELIVNQPKAIEEPSQYPVFFLSSVVYHNPSDWSIWVSGHKITAQKNDTDVDVVSVEPGQAILVWHPTFVEAVTQRVTEKKFAATDDLKNKLATMQPISFDQSTGSTTFRLRQNQSFSTSYYSIFEGYIESTALPALPVNAVAGEKPISDKPAEATAMPSANGNTR